MEPTHDLARLVEQSTSHMAREYDRIRARSREDAGTAGDQGEENWAQLLRAWLPAEYHVVTKGRIIATDGTTSPQLDVLVLSSSYPVGLLSTKLYLAAGVVAAFECKNTLRLAHLDKVFRTAGVLGDMFRADYPLIPRPVYGLLAHSHSISTNPARATERLSGAIAEADLRYTTDPADHLDLICVADLGTWSHMLYWDEGGDDPDARALATCYMGPLSPELAAALSEVVQPPAPIGRMLAGLLLLLSDSNPNLAPLARYFQVSGIFGIGSGQVRRWDVHIPDLESDIPTMVKLRTEHLDAESP